MARSMDKWVCISTRLPKKNSRIEVMSGDKVKRMFYTAGMKGEDLTFTHWRYVDGGYDYKPKAEWYPNYELIKR